MCLPRAAAILDFRALSSGQPQSSLNTFIAPNEFHVGTESLSPNVKHLGIEILNHIGQWESRPKLIPNILFQTRIENPRSEVNPQFCAKTGLKLFVTFLAWDSAPEQPIRALRLCWHLTPRSRSVTQVSLPAAALWLVRLFTSANQRPALVWEWQGGSLSTPFCEHISWHLAEAETDLPWLWRKQDLCSSLGLKDWRTEELLRTSASFTDSS